MVQDGKSEIVSGSININARDKAVPLHRDPLFVAVEAF
jgi:hypothetical protein